MSKRRDRLRKQGRVFGPLCDFVRGRECLVDGCSMYGQPHHVRARGKGGSWEDWIPIIKRDNRVVQFVGIVGNVVPLCHEHHGKLEAEGNLTFEREFVSGLDWRSTELGEQFRRSDPDAYVKLDEIYALVALRRPELCVPPSAVGLEEGEAP